MASLTRDGPIIVPNLNQLLQTGLIPIAHPTILLSLFLYWKITICKTAKACNSVDSPSLHFSAFLSSSSINEEWISFEIVVTTLHQTTVYFCLAASVLNPSQMPSPLLRHRSPLRLITPLDCLIRNSQSSEYGLRGKATHVHQYRITHLDCLIRNPQSRIWLAR